MFWNGGGLAASVAVSWDMERQGKNDRLATNHVQYPGLVQFVNRPFRWDADGGDEEFCAAFDDHVEEVIEFAFRIVDLHTWSLAR